MLGRQSFSPVGAKSVAYSSSSTLGSPSRRLSPIPNGSLQVDVHSSGRKANGIKTFTTPRDHDVSHLMIQSSHLRNSVCGEVLEQNFREKLADLSRALVSEKEANISLEKRYCDEIEYRGSLESKMLEYERLLRVAEESLVSEKSRAEAREEDLISELEKEKSYRHLSEQQLIATKVQLAELSKEHQDHTRESVRKVSELNSEVSRHSHQCSVMKKELEEHKLAAERRQQRLLDDLRQTDDQREHLNKVYHASVAKVADLESELASVRQDLNAQIKVLKEKLEKEHADRIHMDDLHQREVRTLNDRIRSLGDSLQGEQDVLTKTKDDLNSTTLARDRLQARLNHLMDEATEKRKEYEAKLKAEIDQRERLETHLTDKNSEFEQVPCSPPRTSFKLFFHLERLIETLNVKQSNHSKKQHFFSKQICRMGIFFTAHCFFTEHFFLCSDPGTKLAQ